MKNRIVACVVAALALFPGPAEGAKRALSLRLAPRPLARRPQPRNSRGAAAPAAPAAPVAAARATLNTLDNAIAATFAWYCRPGSRFADDPMCASLKFSNSSSSSMGAPEPAAITPADVDRVMTRACTDPDSPMAGSEYCAAKATLKQCRALKLAGTVATIWKVSHLHWCVNNKALIHQLFEIMLLRARRIFCGNCACFQARVSRSSLVSLLSLSASLLPFPSACTLELPGGSSPTPAWAPRFCACSASAAAPSQSCASRSETQRELPIMVSL